jgi:hypothetical protein
MRLPEVVLSDGTVFGAGEEDVGRSLEGDTFGAVGMAAEDANARARVLAVLGPGATIGGAGIGRRGGALGLEDADLAITGAGEDAARVGKGCELSLREGSMLLDSWSLSARTEKILRR